MTDEQLKAFATQLSHPSGEAGTTTAEMMHVSNIGMTRSALGALKPESGDKILELGHGSGNHIPEILSRYDIAYTGLEISELMHQTARSAAGHLHASFKLYDGDIIPFEQDSFHKIMTVNTLYFWQDPVKMLKEIYRILKPGGLFSCAFAQKDFMETLPFTRFVFKLYDENAYQELVAQTAFNMLAVQHHKETVLTKDGKPTERTYVVAVLQK